MLGWFSIILIACTQAQARDEAEDEACGPRPLDEFCEGSCPDDKAEAVANVCEVYGNKQWLEAQNECGGTTVHSAPNLPAAIWRNRQ